MRTVRLLPILALLGAVACTDVMQPQMDEQPLFAVNAAAKTDVTFTMAVTGFGDAYFADPGRSGRGKIRNYQIFFEVAGDLEGTAEMVLNSNWDKAAWWATGPGRGSTWGVLSIMTDGGTWEGNLTAEFVFDPTQSDWNAQLFSTINLHGPDGRKLKAACDETSAESEVLACTGEILSPHG